jgi:protein KRI1
MLAFNFFFFQNQNQELTEDVEKDFFKALSLLKSKDAKIYNKDECRFFEEKPKTSKTESKKSNGEKKSKPFHLKDLEREMILNK